MLRNCLNSDHNFAIIFKFRASKVFLESSKALEYDREEACKKKKHF